MGNDASRLKFEGKWDQMKGKVQEKWGDLTDDDLDRTQGQWDQVVGRSRSGLDRPQRRSRLSSTS